MGHNTVNNRFFLEDARIVLPHTTIEHATLELANGSIVAIHQSAPPSYDASTAICYPLRGLTIIPGMIDMHGDMIEQEAEPRTGAYLPLDLAVHELDRRLIAAGVTTAYAAISFWEPLDEKRKVSRAAERAAELIAAIADARQTTICDMRVHARYEITTPSVAPPLRRALLAGQVQMLSLMDHTPGQGQYRNVERYVQYLAAYRSETIEKMTADAHERMRRAREDTSFWEIAHELVGIARTQGLAVASHDDDTAQKVRLMADLGVTISEFPVALEAAAAAREYGMHVAMGAPNALRGQSHSGNLSARDAITTGFVDMLAADYAPSAMLSAAWAIAEQQILPLHEAIALVTRNPAEALGLHDRGQIAIGKRADLVVADTTTSQIRAVFCAGALCYGDAAMSGRIPHG
jgi:alpha-D-ribose 1-methylphosphonate 5-triphosphate diphosphatase